MGRPDLARILVGDGVVSARELSRIAAQRRETPLWAAAIAAGAVSAEEIYYALAQRSGGAIVEDEALDALRAPVVTMTAAEAHAAGVMPLALSDEGQLTVAMVDPTDEATLEIVVARARALEGRALLARRAAVDAAIERLYGDSGSVKVEAGMSAEVVNLPAAPPTPSPDVLPPPVPGADDALFARALMQALEVVVDELELRLPPVGDDAAVHRAGETARLSRRVARELGLPRRNVDEIGVAALLAALDRRLVGEDRYTAEGPRDRFAQLGWAALAEGGLGPTLRTLSAGLGRSPTAPVAAQIIGAVSELLDLGAVAALSDLDAVSQLLRAGAPGQPARATVVDALLRVLAADGHGDADPTQRRAPPPARRRAHHPEE